MTAAGDPGTTARLGALVLPDGATRFEVWAPEAEHVELVLVGEGSERRVACHADQDAGTWVATVIGAGHGQRYRYALDGLEPLPDPASRWQPDGVHGPSAVVDERRFRWSDAAWPGITLAGAVFYELHVGTFTPDGTFGGVAGQLDRLADLGVTAIELMPVNAFPGERNWGYDGVFASAVQHSYGGPEGLARLVDAAHARGLGVVLDVVYNHVGPDGNVLGHYGPYFTDAYRTPWGPAINVAGPGSDGVRRTFVESAVRWITDFHVDGLRVDAIDAIVDPTAVPFLEELTEAVHAAGRTAGRGVVVVAESSDNDPAVVRPPAAGGLGFDAVWNDDVHHTLRVALTGQRHGYYVDYDGIGDLADALAHRWVFRGRHSAFRGRRHGRPADDVEPARFVVCSANHDQVGNTPAGARPPYEQARQLVAAATVLLSPFTPLLFMGQEYGETAPFPFFVDHTDPHLVDATRTGRLREFADAGWHGAVADPGDPATFAAAVLDPSLAGRPGHAGLLAAHTELLALRRRLPTLTDAAADQRVTRVGDTIVLDRRTAGERTVVVANFGPDAADVAVGAGLAIAFDTADPRWDGDGDAAALAGGRLRVGGLGVVLLSGR